MRDSLQLRDGSTIDAEALGNGGDGGNVTIRAGTIVALENSDIIANAQSGFGGRIAIATLGLFGTAFRPQRTPQSDITAASDLGSSFDGTVAIAVPEIDPSDGFTDLSTTLLDVFNEFDRDPCKNLRDSRFVFTGRGGLPRSPFDEIWDITRDSDTWIAWRNDPSPTTPGATELTPQKIVEATSWQIDRNGNVELFASNNLGLPAERLRQRWHHTDRCNTPSPAPNPQPPASKPHPMLN